MQASVNPMLLTDEEFEKFRYKGDPDIDTIALTVMEVLDREELFQIMGTIQKNSDPAILCRTEKCRSQAGCFDTK